MAIIILLYTGTVISDREHKNGRLLFFIMNNAVDIILESIFG